MNLDPSTGNPVESKRIADANKRAEEAYMKKMESLLGQDLYRMEVFTAEEEEEMEAIRALQEAERKGQEAYNRMAKPEDRIPKAEGGKFPDLTGDGKVTQADILKGRGVFNEGGTLMVPREKYGSGSFVNVSKKVIRALRKLSTDNAQGAGVTYSKAQLIRDYKTPEAFLDAYSDLLAHKEFNDKVANELIDSGLDPKSVKRILTTDKINKLASIKLTEGEKSIQKKVLDKYMAKDESGRLLPIKKTPILIEFEEGREPKAEGSLMMPTEGMPVDTYDNIPPDEMDEALASQLPDDEMEESYIDYILDESLNDSEQEYLADALQKDPKLEGILDKVMLTASEFSGAGEVEGPGTGVSDSIPARLSDGEFVFTRKATDQLGADNLQRMMDDAERAYDGGYQMKAEGGMMEDEDPGISKTQEEIEKLMMGANRMPSLQ